MLVCRGLDDSGKYSFEVMGTDGGRLVSLGFVHHYQDTLGALLRAAAELCDRVEEGRSLEWSDSIARHVPQL